MSNINDTINSDAIYAALVYLRDRAESGEGKTKLRDIAGRDVSQLDTKLTARTTSGSFHPGQRVSFTPELLEEIYPGEHLSVEVGLELGRWVVYGSPGMLEAAREGDAVGDPIQQAISRFIADRAH